MMQHVVSYSGGAGSYCAARRVCQRHGPETVALLFADTCMEDEDTYRFLVESAASLGAKLITIQDGRTPWQVFRDERFLGNSRMDPCSKILKRKLLDKWVAGNCHPDKTIRYVGIDWTEQHRMDAIRERLAPYKVEAPMLEPPRLSKADMIAEIRSAGLAPPRLYAMGFHHNNCGGFCVKAGQAQFRLLLLQMPERYAEHEAQEEAMRKMLGRDDISILRDRRGGQTRPLTLREFRERIERDDQDCDLLEWGGCACGI